ncbi:hypothetical protein WN48_10187 [Eufriesea mexicana]|nr:hypothetical protein WN48_10187 [Eufriesea mexicana]
MGADDMNREIPSSTLATLRGILVSSLSRENLGPHDLPVHENGGRHRPYRKVHFREGTFRGCILRPVVGDHLNINGGSGAPVVVSPRDVDARLSSASRMGL